MFAEQQVVGLKRINDTLRTRIARLELLGNFGSANLPDFAAERA